MSRKITSNSDENVRNSILDRRTISLFKKIEEFSILCSVDVAVIIFSPEKNQPVVWKSSNLTKEVLIRYFSFSEFERIKKLIIHEKYLSKKVDKKKEQVNNIEKMNEEKEIKFLFNQLIQGKCFTDFDSKNIKGLLKFIATMMDKINERKEQFNLQQQPFHPPNSPSNFKLGEENVTQSPSSIEDLINDMWFVETTMASNQNFIGLGGESSSKSESMTGDSLNAKDDGHSKDLN
ncbi:agamous-like MADS-box protein AGL86 [Capsicum galapagoense]